MERDYEHYWDTRFSGTFMRRMVVVSVLIHLLPFLVFGALGFRHKEPLSLSFSLQLAQGPDLDVPVPDVEGSPPPSPPQPNPAPPKPKVEEKKPEQKVEEKKEEPKVEEKKPEPKVEEKKEEPLPEPDLKVEEKQPEPKKDEKKPAAKKEEKKEEPKKDNKKAPKLKPIDPVETMDSKELAKADPEQSLLMKGPRNSVLPTSPGNSDLKNPGAPGPRAQVVQDLPPELVYWARQVQRKIDEAWVVPVGLRLDAEQTMAEVSFWVNRNGELMEPPEITKPATDPALGESGVQAIKLAAPFPPLPPVFTRDEQQIVYAFSLQ